MSDPSSESVPHDVQTPGQTTQLDPARPDDVWLSVHALSEWVFCPRAGIIASMQRDGRLDDDWSRPNLDYSPCYELQQIEHELRRQIRRLWFWSLVIVGLVGLACWAIYQSDTLTSVGSALGILASGHRIARLLTLIEPLLALRRFALTAKPKMIELPLSGVEPVNWWELLAAGYQSVAYAAPLKDDVARLCGCPWRVLRYAGLRIPVIKVDSQEKTTDVELRETHRVRLATYRHLLVLCEAAEVPFGVVLSANSYQGWLVPLTDETEKVGQIVQAFRNTLRSKTDPDAPAAGVCVRCPHGFPTEYRSGRETRLGESILRAFGVRGRDQRNYHSVCGDRFRWCPPHEHAAVLALQIKPTNHS